MVIDIDTCIENLKSMNADEMQLNCEVNRDGFKYKIHLKIKREELTENESSAKDPALLDTAVDLIEKQTADGLGADDFIKKVENLKG